MSPLLDYRSPHLPVVRFSIRRTIGFWFVYLACSFAGWIWSTIFAGLIIGGPATAGVIVGLMGYFVVTTCLLVQYVMRLGASPRQINVAVYVGLCAFVPGYLVWILYMLASRYV